MEPEDTLSNNSDVSQDSSDNVTGGSAPSVSRGQNEDPETGSSSSPLTQPFISLTKKQFFFSLAVLLVVVLFGFSFYKGYLPEGLFPHSSREPAVVVPSPPSASPSAAFKKASLVSLTGKVLFTSNRDGDSAIYYSDLEGKNIAKFIENIPGRSDSTPIVSPNKKYIVFYSDRSGEKDSYGNPKLRLYLFDIAAKSVAEVSDKAGISAVTWLPDSSGFVAVYSNFVDNPAVYTLYSYSVGKGFLKTLVTSSQFEPFEKGQSAYLGNLAVSKDSRRVAFVVNHYKNPAVSGVWIYNLFDGRSWRISDKGASGTIEFSEDGQKLEFDAYADNAKKRYRVDIDSGFEQEVPLIEKGEYCYQYNGMGGGAGGAVCARSDIYFSDGRRKAYIDTRDNKSDIYVSNIDGSEEERLTTSGGVQKIVFGPEEKYIIYSYSKADDSAIFLLDLENPSIPQRISSTSSSFVEYLPN